MQCEAVLLGRAPSDGTIDATTLAALIRTFLLSKAFATRRYQIRCRNGLEFIPTRARRRRLDDEGFESDADDDTSSTKSVNSDDTISNSSSCCFVEDHVFKTPVKSTSSVGTDSANSSGASDTDDLELLARDVKTAYQRDGVETYPTSEVVFCHTDPQFPKVAVWVVKKTSGLETLVFECRSGENLKRLCASFQELSRRSKLDQYTHTNRRKATTATAHVNKYDCDSSSNASTLKAVKSSSSTSSTTTCKSVTNVSTPLSSVLVKSLGPQAALRNQQQTIIRTLKNTTDAITKFSSGDAPSFPKAKPPVPPKNGDILALRATPKPTRSEEMPPMSRFNLVQRTDGDGVTHIEISRGARDDSADTEDLNGPSSILSINTPDAGNLLSSEKNVYSKSRFTKEIESVIRSDVDTAGERRDTQRQRQPAVLVLADEEKALRKVWTTPGGDRDDDINDAQAPLRPERRRYVKKKNQAPEPPKEASKASKPGKEETLKIKGTQFGGGGNQQKIVKGQFIRVSVDQTPTQKTNAWGYANGNVLAYTPAPWSLSATAKNKAPRRKSVDDIFASSQKYHQQQQQQQKRGYRSRSPPNRPMAYRYIDTVPHQTSNSLSKRFFGVSQKLKEFGGAVVNGSQYTTRRRNSIGELAHAQQVAAASGGNSNLKSVIKKTNKTRMGEYQEPKKVTFSAYATVQVVD